MAKNTPSGSQPNSDQNESIPQNNQQSPTPNSTPPLSTIPPNSNRQPQPAPPVPPSSPPSSSTPSPQQTPLPQSQNINPTPNVSPNMPTNKPVKRKQAPRKFPVFGCFVGFILFYILTVVLGIFVLWLNKDSQSFLTTFNLINDTELKEFILSSIQWSFFPLGLLFLILTIIGAFILSTAKKDQIEKKKKGTKMLITNLVILVILIPVWVGIYNFVLSLPVAGQRAVAAEITIEPEDTSELVAPVSIKFSSVNIRKALSRTNQSIERIAWDFNNDQDFEVEVHKDVDEVTQLFKTKGTTTVSVKVWLAGDQEKIYSKTVTISSAQFEADPESGPAPLNITFDATDITSDKNIRLFKWDFDNDLVFDVESDEARTTFTFDKIGKYQINLQTIDKNNLIENYSRSIEVKKGEDLTITPVIKVSPGTEGQIPFQVQFLGEDSQSSAGEIVSYQWNFGDGTTPKVGEKQNYIFKKAGTYNVELTVTDQTGNKKTITQEIVAQAPTSVPTAVIKAFPDFDKNIRVIEGIAPLEIQFNGSESTDKDENIVNYAWDFDGDGEDDEFGDKVTHIYREEGRYEVNLKVIDADQQKSVATVTVNVQGKQTSAIIQADPESGPVPLTVQFDATQSTIADGSEIVNYEWDFGDGTGIIPTGAITSHVYPKVGSYQVTLKIHSSTGIVSETSKMIFARVVPLQACFQASRTSGEHPLTVSFDSTCSTGTISTWKWEFGDGFISDKRNISHTFKKAGTYTTVLEVTDPKNTVNTYSMTINVQ